VQKPYLFLLNIRKGMGSFWDDVTAEQITSIYSLCQPTGSRVIDHLYMDPKTPKDDQIYRWLQRYIRICTDEALVNFMRFCTATDIIRPNCRIGVQTQLMPPSAIRPKSRTCFGILVLPSNYVSFSHMRKNLDMYIQNPMCWDLSDV